MAHPIKYFRVVTIVYWTLLLYVLAALLWWFISLWEQNNQIVMFKKQILRIEKSHHSNYEYDAALKKVEHDRKRKITKFVGEGSMFLILIIIGAAIFYRYLIRQFRLQLQQENFLMTITHELKTPIAVSQLNLETLLKHDLSQEQKQHLLSGAIQETQRLNHLTSNALTVAQLDSAKYATLFQIINFSEFVLKHIEQFSVRYPRTLVTKKIDAEIFIRGDENLLSMLLNNLLENAEKYSTATKKIDIILTQQNEHPIFSLADNGIGIDENERKNIFKKFYRSPNQNVNRKSGSGLGLYLCKKIITLHKATVSVKNNLPQGTIFEIKFLPLYESS